MSLNPKQISGTRGVGSPFCAAVHGQNLGDYIKTANQNTLVIVQIETREGLENCEEIAQVPGIGTLTLSILILDCPFLRLLADCTTLFSDMLFIGPNDLASSLGYVAGDHPNIPEVQAAIARVLKACQSAGKYSGMVSLNRFKHIKVRPADISSSSVPVENRSKRDSSRAVRLFHDSIPGPPPSTFTKTDNFFHFTPLFTFATSPERTCLSRLHESRI